MDLRQSQEIINVNKIFFEDSFIDLINKLSKTINNYNHQSIFLISKATNLFSIFENNIKKLFLINEQNKNIYNYNNNQEFSKTINDINLITKEFKLIINKTDENLKFFFENAKNIFKEMKNKKNSSLEDIYNDYISQNSPKNSEHKNENKKNPNLNHITKIISYSQNQINQKNRIINKGNLYNRNISLSYFLNIKKLIKSMSYYNDIISKNSPKEKENYINLQKQLLTELNKSININSSINKEIGNKIIPEFISIDNIRNTKSYTSVNNNEMNLTKSNSNNFNNVNRANSNSSIINKNNSNDLKIEINNLKSQLEKTKFNYKTLEKKFQESQNNLNFLKNKEQNIVNKLKFDLGNKIRSLESQNIELKRKYTLLFEKDSSKEIKKSEIREKSEENSMDLDLKLAENEILKLKKEMKNKKKEYQLNIIKLNEDINDERIENEKKIKIINEKYFNLSKSLADKDKENKEIQVLQKNNKIKINELNKLKLIVKNNENHNENQKKSLSPDKFNNKDIFVDNSTKINNLSDRNSYNINNKEIVSILKSEISQLKNELKKGKEEKEILISKLNVLEKDISDKKNENELLENELNYKNNEVEEVSKIIDELKSEKNKYIQKIKEYKDIDNLNLTQIKILKSQIKEMERQQNNEIENNKNKKEITKKEYKKRINELQIENLNIKKQLNIELDYNNKLKNEVKFKTGQTERLNREINKLKEEKESNKFKESFFVKKNNYDYYNPKNIIRSKTNEKYKSNHIININEKEMNIKNLFITDSFVQNNNEQNKKNQKVWLTDFKTNKIEENDDYNKENYLNKIEK